MRLPARSSQPTALAGFFALLVLTLFALQLREAQQNADRRIGIAIESKAQGIRVSEVERGGAAERGGLRAGDLLLEIDGHAIHHIDDYDIPAAQFERGKPVEYRISRNNHAQTLRVTPGTEMSWLPILLRGLVLLCYLALALTTAHQNSVDLRSRLLIVFLFLLALELAIPLGLVGQRNLDIAAWALYFLAIGAQLSVELHLASVIPKRPPWLDRHPWLVSLFYLLGGAIGLLTSLTYLLEDVGEHDWLPWSYGQVIDLLGDIVTPLTTIAVLFLLARTTLRCPDFEGRQQAALVLVGALPRALHTFATLALEQMGLPISYTLEPFYPLALLAYPVAVFIAMYRYHLFDVEWMVRRSLLYTVLTTALVLTFYGVLAAGGAFFSRIVGPEHSLWMVSGSTLILGLLFGYLRRWLKHLIDQRLYPERQVLRKRLVELVSELPAQGKIPRMGSHLVDRICKIFAASSATLMLVEPRSKILLTTASSRCDGEGSGSLSLLLDPQDPGVELLRSTAKPLPAKRLVAISPGLAQRFELLRAELVVPLVHHGKLVGVLILGKTETDHRYPAEEKELLHLLAHQVATTFENVRLYESATYESLTGLLRREATLELLANEVERAQRYDRPLSIGFADLDHFKSVNDRFGHLAGDSLLKDVANELTRGLRKTDAIGRYGGEEFLLIFPETDLEGAAKVAEKLRVRTAALRTTLHSGHTIGVSISIGLACLDPTMAGGGNPIEALINAADQALYRAKANGRNRVEWMVAS